MGKIIRKIFEIELPSDFPKIHVICCLVTLALIKFLRF